MNLWNLAWSFVWRWSRARFKALVLKSYQRKATMSSHNIWLRRHFFLNSWTKLVSFLWRVLLMYSEVYISAWVQKTQASSNCHISESLVIYQFCFNKKFWKTVFGPGTPIISFDFPGCPAKISNMQPVFRTSIHYFEHPANISNVQPVMFKHD